MPKEWVFKLGHSRIELRHRPGGQKGQTEGTRRPGAGWDVKTDGQRELRKKRGLAPSLNHTQLGPTTLKAGENTKLLFLFIHLFILKTLTFF